MSHYSPYQGKRKFNPLLNQYGDSTVQSLSQTSGQLVSKLKKEAEKQSFPIEQDESMLEVLTSMDLGENIPPQLYAVIAEMLMFIQEVENKETVRREGGSSYGSPARDKNGQS